MINYPYLHMKNIIPFSPCFHRREIGIRKAIGAGILLMRFGIPVDKIL